ncbi:MAG: Asp23/Gls24 family envelope stress response protein [Candidatus Acetothermia bacterium]|jgi:uncharacterized alkaline shock family protein YloU|nr:Asp23/Gls24 family envelope stress response protein [Candidatus Acetothermia bacterium]MDH7504859.1 Asp23/Gls24 family envelope stress response protein [Candidatus Acetothermia bacterium]
MEKRGEEQRRREKGRVSQEIPGLGRLTIAEEVFVAIAEQAVGEVKGLGKTKGSLVEQVAQIFGGRGKGVEAKVEDGTVKFDLRVSVLYGHPIPAVAQQIQEKVTRRVEEMTGLKVSAVDVYIQEVQLPREPEA